MLFYKANMTRILMLAAIATMLVACGDYGVRDVSENPARVEGYKIGGRYVMNDDAFLCGLLFDEPLSHYEDESYYDLWFLVLSPPVGQENGSIPDSFEGWKKEKGRFTCIYGIVTVGTTLTVEKIQEVMTLKDHGTQVLARIDDGEFKGKLVDLSRISNVSSDHLMISRDNKRLKNVEQGASHSGGKPPS